MTAATDHHVLIELVLLEELTRGHSTRSGQSVSCNQLIREIRLRQSDLLVVAVMPSDTHHLFHLAVPYLFNGPGWDPSVKVVQNLQVPFSCLPAWP